MIAYPRDVKRRITLNNAAGISQWPLWFELWKTSEGIECAGCCNIDGNTYLRQRLELSDLRGFPIALQLYPE